MKLSTKVILVVTITVTLISGLIFYSLSKRYEHQIHDSLLRTARAFYTEIIITRTWVAQHHGIYVDKRFSNEVSPFLKNAEVQTTDGRTLILKTPAQVTRELSELSEIMGGKFQFHITSLTPLNPRNTPNEFERAALESFKKRAAQTSQEGYLEYTRIEKINNKDHFRYFGPLFAKNSCLTCHGKQGYREGDITGGISVLVPMESIRQAMRENYAFMAGSALVTILLLSIVVYHLIRRTVLNPLHQIENAAREIEKGNYQTPIPYGRDDEIGDLARAFNHMQKTLQIYTKILQESERKYRTLLQHSPEAILIVDEKDRILDTNENITAMTQYRVLDLIHQPLHTLLDPQSRRFYPPQEGAKGPVKWFECLLRRKDGTTVPVEVYVNPNFSFQGQKRPAKILYIRDISERKRIEEYMIETEKMYALGQLSSGVAHEIRNPLFGIRNNINYLKEKYNGDQELNEICGEILQSVERMNKIVNDVLDFSKPHRWEFGPNNLHDVIRRSIELVRKQFEKQSIAIKTRLDNKVPEMIFDAHRMEQVLINLFTNALQAMRPGGKLTVETAFRESTQRVEIRVQDTGCGIPQEDLKRIFDPFFTRRPQGTGLGLTIVRRIIQQHRGTIQVQSRLHEGTVFILELPVDHQNQT